MSRKTPPGAVRWLGQTFGHLTMLELRPDRRAVFRCELCGEKITAAFPTIVYARSKKKDCGCVARMASVDRHPLYRRWEKLNEKGKLCDAWSGRGGFARFLEHVPVRPDGEDWILGGETPGEEVGPRNLVWRKPLGGSINFCGSGRPGELYRNPRLATAHAHGIKRTTYYARLRMGWNEEDASTVPTRPRRGAR